MYQDGWKRVKKKEQLHLLQLARRAAPKHMITAGSTHIDWRALPFYQHACLVRLQDAGWDNQQLKLYFVRSSARLYRLSGEPDPIYLVNEQAPLRLCEWNVIDYLRFFCFFVRGDAGAFIVLESPDAAHWGATISMEDQKTLLRNFKPPTCEGRHENGSYVISATVLYGAALYAATFRLAPPGAIEMVDDEPLGALSFSVTAPIG